MYFIVFQGGLEVRQIICEYGLCIMIDAHLVS
jgi:hypothetical protein